MTVTATRGTSEAEKQLSEQFESGRANLPGNDAVAALRAERFQAFAGMGLPTRRIESWHYTDLRTAMRSAFALAAPADAQAIAAAKKALAELPDARNRIVLVDGFYQAALSEIADANVTVRGLAEALVTADRGLVEDMSPAHASGDPALDLNAALMNGGVVVDIRAKTSAEAPVEIVSIASRQVDAAVFSRNLVRAGKDCAVAIVERHISIGQAGLQANNALVIAAEPGSSVSHAFIDDSAGAGLARVNSLIVTIGAQARLSCFALHDGGGFARRQGFVRFAGAHAALELSGLSLVRGKDHIDTTLVVNHDCPDCVSKEFFKQIVDGAGTGVFQGKVRVAPEAQKTDGAMKSQTILLGDDSAMYNKPELEIFADDVACSHGATCGSLDANQLFYAMARGLPRSDAEGLLLEAFGADAIEHVEDENLREELAGRLRAWLGKRTA